MFSVLRIHGHDEGVDLVDMPWTEIVAIDADVQAAIACHGLAVVLVAVEMDGAMMALVPFLDRIVKQDIGLLIGGEGMVVAHIVPAAGATDAFAIVIAANEDLPSAQTG